MSVIELRNLLQQIGTIPELTPELTTQVNIETTKLDEVNYSTFITNNLSQINIQNLLHRFNIVPANNKKIYGSILLQTISGFYVQYTQANSTTRITNLEQQTEELQRQNGELQRQNGELQRQNGILTNDNTRLTQENIDLNNQFPMIAEFQTMAANAFTVPDRLAGGYINNYTKNTNNTNNLSKYLKYQYKINNLS
jgi:cell division protein FtsB